MSQIVRLRCPVCGMLGNQKRLDGDYEFEVVIQEITSKGRGKIRHRYYQPQSEEGTWLLKLALADKMRAVLKGLEDEVRDEKHELWVEKWSKGELDAARLVSSTYHTEFSEVATSVRGFTWKPKVEAYPVQITVEDPEIQAEVVREVASPGILTLFDLGTRQLQNAVVMETDIAASTAIEPVIHRPGSRGFSTGSQGEAAGIAELSATVEHEEEEDEIKTEIGTEDW